MLGNLCNFHSDWISSLLFWSLNWVSSWNFASINILRVFCVFVVSFILYHLDRELQRLCDVLFAWFERISKQFIQFGQNVCTNVNHSNMLRCIRVNSCVVKYIREHVFLVEWKWARRLFFFFVEWRCARGSETRWDAAIQIHRICAPWEFFI